MTDIVQRLRDADWNDNNELFSMAADMIEQLRADRDIWRQKAIELGLENSELIRLGESQSKTINKLEKLVLADMRCLKVVEVE